ncbi:hypothetical protein COLO4_13501 [Corchorus olitorius]|uniref:SHSP domain-containing protein n=1 Tax=Corchorus olitorius TaxID=93759 RepID=A0A1R3JWB8_9ROSI|nr:hypothetical protein COLO4_13501 [Corchorus olitorius]
MASTSKGNDSQAITELRSKKAPSAVMPNKDQRFLLYFIFGTYFGPDLKGEKSHKSVLERKSEGLPPYSSGDLAGSHMEMVQLERIYYYILRKANKSLAVKSSLLDQFIKGNLPTPPGDESAAKYPQFPNLFPMELHCQQSKNQCNIIDNIVFIHNPEIGYIRIEHIARFGRLTGLEDFSLDRDAARLHGSAENDNVHSMIVQDGEPAGDLSHLGSSPRVRKIKLVQDVLRREDQHVRIPPVMKSAATSSADAAMTNKAPVLAKNEAYTGKKDDAAMLFFPSPPSREEMANIVAATKKGAALMGTAAMGKVGPIVGLMDIGECEDAYMFRVSLPGVKRDESEFSCEVEDDGKVLIRGVTTTGEKTVYRFSQTFEMLSQNLCPPGHFSISFQLPGPVDPQQFSGNFGTDGILEGIVMKKTQI